MKIEVLHIGTIPELVNFFTGMVTNASEISENTIVSQLQNIIDTQENGIGILTYHKNLITTHTNGSGQPDFTVTKQEVKTYVKVLNGDKKENKEEVKNTDNEVIPKESNEAQ